MAFRRQLRIFDCLFHFSKQFIVHFLVKCCTPPTRACLFQTFCKWFDNCYLKLFKNNFSGSHLFYKLRTEPFIHYRHFLLIFSSFSKFQFVNCINRRYFKIFPFVDRMLLSPMNQCSDKILYYLKTNVQTKSCII